MNTNQQMTYRKHIDFIRSDPGFLIIEVVVLISSDMGKFMSITKVSHSDGDTRKMSMKECAKDTNTFWLVAHYLWENEIFLKDGK